MWWGVLIGMLGLGAGFFGLRKGFITDGRITEHNRQKRHADMLYKELMKKDAQINSSVEKKLTKIKKTTIRRKKQPDPAALISRTNDPW